MSTETFELNCPFCDKLYKLPREKVIKHAGKTIHCRKCGKPFSIPSLPADEPIEEPAVAFNGEIPIAVVAEPPPEALPAEAAVEVPPEPVAFAASETIEPPPLSEYESTLPVHNEDETPAVSSPEPDGEAFTTTALSEDPPSYFSVPEVTSETVELSGEPAFSMEPVEGSEPVNEIPFAGSQEAGEPAGEPMGEPMAVVDPVENHPLQAFDDGGSEAVVVDGDERHTELAPPPLPVEPVSAAPPPPPSSRARRQERISVMPVFDSAAEEEPVPRRRRFGKRTEAVAPVVEEIPTPVVEPVEPAEEVAVAAKAAVVEMPQAAPVDVSEPVAKEEMPEIAEPEAAPGSDDRLIPASVRAETVSVSEEVRGILMGIRRAVMLLAVMSVVIAVVLIGVLLAIVGIIPKR